MVETPSSVQMGTVALGSVVTREDRGMPYRMVGPTVGPTAARMVASSDSAMAVLSAVVSVVVRAGRSADGTVGMWGEPSAASLVETKVVYLAVVTVDGWGCGWVVMTAVVWAAW